MLRPSFRIYFCHTAYIHISENSILHSQRRVNLKCNRLKSVSQNPYYFIFLYSRLFSLPFSTNRTCRTEYVSVSLCYWKCTLSDFALRCLVLETVYQLPAPLNTYISTITNLSWCCNTKSKPCFYLIPV